MTDRTYSGNRLSDEETANKREELLERMVELEGDYSDHPNDAGGPTRWGITKKVAEKYGYKGDMKKLSRGTAVDIYRKKYWDPLRPDEVVAVRMSLLAWEIFDVRVNMWGTTKEMWRRALNVLNRGGELYDDVDDDANLDAIIKVTKAAAKNLKQADAVLACVVNSLQGARYVSLAEGEPDKEVFMRGWLRKRVMMWPPRQ